MGNEVLKFTGHQLEQSAPKDLKHLADEELTISFTRAAGVEREAIADVVRHAHEFMVRRLYLNYNCTSLFEYMTSKLGYANATAQKRIDAARLLNFAPGLTDDLASGAIGLTQVSVLAHGLRQFEKECASRDENVSRAEIEDHALRLLDKMKDQDVEASSVMIAQDLNIEIKEFEKVRRQRDESVRLEMTLSKEQMEELRRVKDLTSHVNHNANWADVISYLTKEFLKRKDPTVEKPVRAARQSKPSDHSNTDVEIEPTKASKFTSDRKSRRVAIPMAVKREVARHGWKCQHVDKATGEICESTYQVQYEHIRSVSKGGGNDVENLQLFCAQHNRLKYRQQG